LARHNREGAGQDQRGFGYTLSYQPDWLRLVKVTRKLESGRQSTKTLFKNPAPCAEAPPGDRVRTRILSPEQDLDVEIAVADPDRSVTRVRVACAVPVEGGLREEEVEFTLEGDLPRPPGD
jgi:hypothetical protein